jgi:predicted TIM-barrel fold metal-dependent hydrolase
MKSWYVCLAAVVCVATLNAAPPAPRVDAHQHLFSPAVAQLIGVKPILARDLIALLDTAHIEYAVVLSVAYIWGAPGRHFDDEYERVKAENDWTSEQVGRYPDRLRGYCSVNPLKAYALTELARCSRDPHLHYGLKLHFGNSVVDYHNAEHIARVREVFGAANGYRMPMLVHMRASISQKLPYGRDEARIFLDQLLPAAPDVNVQIAHLAGTGDYADPPVDAALSVFVEAIARNDPRTKRLYFDVTTSVPEHVPDDEAKLIAMRIRQLGVQRILYGSDAAAGGNLPPKEGWGAFCQIPLTDREFTAIANSLAPFSW